MIPQSNFHLIYIVLKHLAHQSHACVEAFTRLWMCGLDTLNPPHIQMSPQSNASTNKIFPYLISLC